MRFALPLCLLAACSGIQARDVATSFEQEYRSVQLQLPTRANLAVGRVEQGRMARTELLAQQYLDTHDPDTMYGRYVRSLLACVHLMEGDYAAAEMHLKGIQPRDERKLITRENAVTRAVLRAVDLCRSVEARAALPEMLKGRMPIGDYVAQYGSYVGLPLPHPAQWDYDKAVSQYAKRLKHMCFARLSGDPRAMERIHEGRTEVHRLLGEQVYNDAAALLMNIPDDGGADREFLEFLAVSSVIVYAEVFREVVPMQLSQAQKAWITEQAEPVFGRAERLVDRLRSTGSGHEVYDVLPARVQDSRILVRGWIATR
ncbi:MAG: hypothetical protein ACYTGN_04335 [Planctomycetota bacterium]